MQTFRKKGTIEVFVVAAGATVTKNNFVELASGCAKNITDGAGLLGVAVTGGTAGQTVAVIREPVVVEVKADAGVALTQGDVAYATGSMATVGGKAVPVVDAGATGDISIGVVVDGNIPAGGYGKIRTTPSDAQAIEHP